MCVFCQVSSTPESMYEEINKEIYTDDYYLNMFLERLARIVEKYDSISNSNKTMTADTFVRVLIRGLIYKETKRSISNVENVPYSAVLRQLDYTSKSSYRFRGWGEGITFKFVPTPIFRYAAAENEIIRAFKNRFGEEFNYEKICNDYRIQKALKLHV